MSAQPALHPDAGAVALPDFPTHRRSGLTLSLHYFFSSVIWSLVIVLLLLGWYAVDKYVFGLKGSPMRMVADPTEFGVRIVGLAHFVIAGMFLVTSPRLKSFGGWAWLVALSAATVGLCWAFNLAGGYRNSLALILFYMYFFIHSFRDEAFFYRIRAGRSVPPEQHTESVLRWMQVIALCVLLALLVSVLTIRDQFGYSDRQDMALKAIFPADWPFIAVFLATVAPLIALATLAFFRIEAQQPDGFAGLLRTHTPLVRVIGYTMLILLSSMLVGAWTYNLVILMHFVAWFEFTTVKIRSLPRAVRASASPLKPMDWFKKSLLGFCVLHIGLSLIFLTLIAINHYGLRRESIVLAGQSYGNPLEFLFSAQHLYFWTIAHVTLSFFPRPIPKPAA